MRDFFLYYASICRISLLSELYGYDGTITWEPGENICICAPTHTHTHRYICITHLHIDIYVYVYIFIYVCVCICIYATLTTACC